MLFLYGDDNSQLKRKSVVVPILLGLTCVAFVVQLCTWDYTLYSFALIPAEISTGQDVIALVEIELNGEVHRFQYRKAPLGVHFNLLSCIFLHGGLVHLMGNMLFLLIFGDQIEDRLGRGRFLCFYLIAGVIAGAAHILCNPHSILPCVGASGAISAVMGAYLVFHPNNKLYGFFYFHKIELSAKFFFAFWIFMQLLLATRGGTGIAVWAHLGGFAFGLLSAFVWLYLEQRSHAKEARPG